MSGGKVLAIGPNVYRIVEMRPDLLELTDDYESFRYVYVPISDQQVHRIPDTESRSVPFWGGWIVRERQELIDGGWVAQNDCIAAPGMWLWQITRKTRYNKQEYLEESRFGYQPQVRDILVDLQAGILSVRYGKTGRRCYYFADDGNNGVWAYALHLPTDDYRDSTVRFRLEPWPVRTRSSFEHVIRWAESHYLARRAANNIPVDLLRLCRSSEPERIAKLIDSGELLNNPELYREDAYIGAYVFLHSYLIYVRTVSCFNMLPISLPEAYMQFHTVLCWWLDAYKREVVHREVYPFHIIRNAELYGRLKNAGSGWQRLETVMKAVGLHTHFFARKIGLPRAEPLYRIKRGEDDLSRDIAELVCTAYPQYDKAWLLTGLEESTRE